jgi:hypothetical protein
MIRRAIEALREWLALDVSPFPVPPPRSVPTPLPRYAYRERAAEPFSGASAAPATWQPWVFSSAGEPVRLLGVDLPLGAGTHHPDGIEITLHGEPRRVYIVEGRVVGMGLVTDVVQPVTAPTQRLPRACTVCGEALAHDAVFCVGCGQTVAAMVFD